MFEFTPETLRALLAKGESETLEFKEAFGTEVIETSVAFANTRGGFVIIGVNDSGQVMGKTFGREALRDYVNRIATATEPSVVPAAEVFRISEGEIAVLQVAEVPLKP